MVESALPYYVVHDRKGFSYIKPTQDVDFAGACRLLSKELPKEEHSAAIDALKTGVIEVYQTLKNMMDPRICAVPLD